METQPDSTRRVSNCNNMKIILPGYEYTKKILSANSYFINKYIPGFDVYFLNYGSFDGYLYCGQFISLDYEQVGGAKSWVKYTIEYLEKLDDELIIFADGDFFITKPYNVENYNKILSDMDTHLVGFMSCGEDPKRFSRVAQYAIWNRKFLLEVLHRKEIRSILKFESCGGRYINGLNKEKEIIAWSPVVNFDRRSAISSGRAPGKVAVGEATDEDIEFLISQGHLKRDELIMEISRHGHPIIDWNTKESI